MFVKQKETMNKLHQIDCMDYMKDIPDKFFDLAIVDPPYGIERYTKQASWIDAYDSTGERTWNNLIPDQKYFNELFRISINIIIWGGNYFQLPVTQSWIFWDKERNKGKNGTWADGELAWTTFKIPLQVARIKYDGFMGKDLNRIHPTQKPIALYKWLLTNYAKPGDKLFDSHSGSGSFRIAAYDMGFDLISCELDADYCRDNEERYQKQIQQIDLFKPEELQVNMFQKELGGLCEKS